MPKIKKKVRKFKDVISAPVKAGRKVLNVLKKGAKKARGK